MLSRYLKMSALLLAGTIAIPLAAQDPVGPQEPADHNPPPPESVEPGFLPPEPAPADPAVDPLPGDPDSVPTDPLPPEDETFEPIPPTPDPAPADDLPPPGTPAEVIERDAEGRATRVRANGVEYTVCTDGQVDGCINPLEAGLDFGGVPLDN